jgi:hypothetical protein
VPGRVLVGVFGLSSPSFLVAVTVTAGTVPPSIEPSVLIFATVVSGLTDAAGVVVVSSGASSEYSPQFPETESK